MTDDQPVREERVARGLLAALAVYSVLVLSLVNGLALPNADPVGRATLLMGDGLVVCWVGLAGLVMVRFRRPLAAWFGRLPLPWPSRFVVLCTLLALLEEVITTTLTNLAPLLGSTPEQSHITASTNYFVVVCCHSVVMFVGMFIGWAWLLQRWRFHPLRVMLLFGLTGTLCEASINWTSLLGGFWFFVYGWMVYLPACTVPHDRGAVPPKFRHHVLAVVLPFVFATPFMAVASALKEVLGVQFLPGV